MKVHGLKKAIAIGVLIAFVWTGMAWATEQNIPNVQKVAGTVDQLKLNKLSIGWADGAEGIFLNNGKFMSYAALVKIIRSGNQAKIDEAGVKGLAAQIVAAAKSFVKDGLPVLSEKDAKYKGASLAGIMLSPDKKSIIFELKYKDANGTAPLAPIVLSQIFDKTPAEKAQIIQKAATVPPPAAKATGTPAPAEAKVLTPAQAAETGSLLNAVAGPFAALAVTLRAAFLASQTKGIGATNQEGVTNDAKLVADTGAGSQHGNTLGGIRGFANSKNLISEAPAQDNGGESLIGSEAKAQLASQVQGKSLADEFIKTKESQLVEDRVGNYEFRFIILTDDEQRQMSPELLMGLNSKDVFIKNSAGYFVKGQEKIVRSGATIQSIFAVSRYYAFYVDFNTSVLNIYSAKEGKWSADFSIEPGINLNDIRGARGVGLILGAFMKYCSNLGLSREQQKQEAMFILNNFAVFLTDEKGAIIDSIFHRAQFRLADGRVGTFTVTGQIDPVTKKGYNWAQVPGGNIYAGLGGDMVDIKTLLTDAKYNDLAAAILGNKSLMVNMIVCVAGSWLLQHGKLNGVAEDIKKFLDYDVSNMPNGFYFDVIDGKVVVVPRGG